MVGEMSPPRSLFTDSTADAARAARMARIANALRDGTYRIDVRRIAQRMLEGASRDPQIDAALRGRS